MGKRTVSALAIPGVTAILLMSGCSSDAICSSGEFPVVQVGDGGGQYCAENGEEPLPGFVRFPEGKVPQHVDDKWDKYWSEHRLDENGREITD